MREALTVLSSKIVVASLLIIGVAALIIGRLRRRLRIVPDQSNRAPLLWLVNFTADARLHRRFRSLARRTRSAAAGGKRHRRRRGRTQAQRLAVDLQDQLISLDERLIDSRSLDFDAQRSVIRALRADAKVIDDLIDRVTLLVQREAKDPSATLSLDPIGELVERVESLERTADADAEAVIESSARAAMPNSIEASAHESESPDLDEASAGIDTSVDESGTVEPLDSPR